MRLQQDELSLPARSLVPMLAGLKPAGDEGAQAIERLLAWDFVLGSDSVPAAIYATWEKAPEAGGPGPAGAARGPRGLPRPLTCRPRS